MMKRYLPVILSVLLVIALAVPAAAGPFTDVPENHWAYEAVKQLAAYGLIIGFPDGEYKGNEPMTRYQLAMVIARMLVSLDAQIKAEVEAAKTAIPAEVPAAAPEKEVVVEQPVIEKVIETTIVEKLKTEELDALTAKVAALEGKVGGIDADAKARIAELEAKIAKGDADNAAAIAALKAELAALEIPVVPETPDVDAAVAEAIVLIDALRAEFVTELDILNARTNCLEGELALAMERIDVLEDKVGGIDTSLAAHLDGHEKVKITGSSEVKFEDIDIRSENADVEAWKDPSEIFKAEDKNHGSKKYAKKTDFKHTLGLTLTAYPADGVTVKAGLKTVTNLFTGALTGNLEVGSLSLEVTTPGILERLYAGDLTLPAGTFTPFTFWGDEILDDDDDPIYKGVVAELGYDIFSGTLLFTRIQEKKAEVPWKVGLVPDIYGLPIVWPEGFDPYDKTTWPEPYYQEWDEEEEDWAVDPETGEPVMIPFDPADPSTWDPDFLIEAALGSIGLLDEDWTPYDLVEITPGAPATNARYAFAGEGKVTLLDNLNLGVAYVRVWDDYLSGVVAPHEVRENFDHVISLSADYAFAEGWKADGEIAKWWHDEDGVGTQGLATRLNLTGVVGPVELAGEFVRVPDGYAPEFVFVDPDDGLETNVKTIGVSAKATVLEALKLTGGYKMTGNASDIGTQWQDWDVEKAGIANVGAEYALAFGDLKLTPSATAECKHFYETAGAWQDGGNRVTVKAGAKAEYAPIEASYYHTYARAKIDGGTAGTFYNRDEVDAKADYDLNENLNLWGDFNWAKQTVADAHVGLDKKKDAHTTTFNVGAKANFAVYEGIDLKATALYGMQKDLLVEGTPWTKAIVTAGVGAQVTPKLKITADGQYQKLDRFYLKEGVYEQYKYAPVTNMIGEINYNYDITTNTVLKLGAKVIKSDVDNRADLSYIARVVTGSLKVTF